ncbi:Galactosyl transferase GMA12/MNN10 family protein [Rhynchospora pubera]|uniref:Galactosyl transferase GMA12/MNN10 family protein n=1 Tax=Rhynchospora pubera TaxID=906938 RepID=A0AAV8C7M4_9POAL|nr:Galactosyl transferase GMA12/MNN10 family protein [Rhynchospora pubera]
MGHEGVGFKSGSTRSGLPTTRSRVPRGRQIQKTFNNVKITVLCGFVTLLVLRGTIGVGNLTGSTLESEDQRVVEDIDRILREIRTDSEPEPQDPLSSLYFANSTAHNWTYAEAVEAVNYSLGPKISDWDQQRQVWLSQNPNFPNRLLGKHRILLVTGSPPNPCDNAIGDHYLLKSTKNKIDYCRLHGIEIVYNMAHLDKELAGYWAKLPLIRKLMLSHPEIEWIWWMDSDAFFTDMAFELPLEKYKNHNLIIHGYPDLLFEQHSWIALNTGSFLFRNCQWSLDLLDAWAPMGPKGIVRELAGKILTANLKGRPAFEADDQSALIYLLTSQQDKWMSKVYVENSYYLHGFWAGLVDKYEEMIEQNHPGLGDERWPFVTHFVGCKPCGSYGDYPVERCLNSMERAFNFGDNQVLRLYGFAHKGLVSPKIKRVQDQTSDPLQVKEKLDMAARITM